MSKGILGTLVDVALSASNVMTIVDNHTEPKNEKERKDKIRRRRAVSDARNVGYLLKRLF